jgi:hypothetical protein
MGNTPMFIGAYRTATVFFTDSDTAGTEKTLLTGGGNATRIQALRAAFSPRAAFGIAILRNSLVIGWVDVPLTTVVTTLNLKNAVEDGESLLLANGDVLGVSLTITPESGEGIAVDCEGGDY